MRTVGRLARKFGLSRSTLLYYDRIGLLRPTGRSAGDYRLYGPGDEERLAAICGYRRAGVPLADIRRILDAPGGEPAAALSRRFEALNREIRELREQQRIILGLLGSGRLPARPFMGREEWVATLRASGFGEEDMDRWHRAFERSDPQGHQAFLEFLCIPDEDIGRIRAFARTPDPGAEAPAEADKE